MDRASGIAAFVALLAPLLAACSGAPPLPADDAKQQVQNVIETKTFDWINPSDLHPHCAKWFAVASLDVADQQVADKTAKVFVRAGLRNGLDKTIRPNDYIADACFGTTATGWGPGEVTTTNWVVSYELWNSGWRLQNVQQQ